ncbi:RidA family protein [Streptomyces sp. bgisy095]|uniref:RidA family protein n=1 Tax=unclassified Streptomyces TaxID=2593676 RepID=UPI003D716776
MAANSTWSGPGTGAALHVLGPRCIGRVEPTANQRPSSAGYVDKEHTDLTLDGNGDLVGAGSLETQVDQVVANTLTALAAVSARPQHVVRSVIYVRSDERDLLGAAWRRLTESALGAAFTTASTLLGVAQLGFHGQLVEVDLTVALPD